MSVSDQGYEASHQSSRLGRPGGLLAVIPVLDLPLSPFLYFPCRTTAQFVYIYKESVPGPP